MQYYFSTLTIVSLKQKLSSLPNAVKLPYGTRKQNLVDAIVAALSQENDSWNWLNDETPNRLNVSVFASSLSS